MAIAFVVLAPLFTRLWALLRLRRDGMAIYIVAVRPGIFLDHHRITASSLGFGGFHQLPRRRGKSDYLPG
jgi:hypothetical protein